jgi:hypothetical protein
MKKTYIAPSIRTTIPPQVALDIDKPCSFNWGPKSMSPRLADKLEDALKVLDCVEMDDDVVDAVFSTMREKRPPYVIMPPKNAEVMPYYSRLVQGWSQLDRTLVRKVYGTMRSGRK